MLHIYYSWLGVLHVQKWHLRVSWVSKGHSCRIWRSENMLEKTQAWYLLCATSIKTGWPCWFETSQSSNNYLKYDYLIGFEGFDLPFTRCYLNYLSVSSPQETKINCVRLANKGMSTLPLTPRVKTVWLLLLLFHVWFHFLLNGVHFLSSVITCPPRTVLQMC